MAQSSATRSLPTHWSSPTTTLWHALLGSVLCFLAFPPLGWYWLIWLAPLPWLLLIRSPELPGRRPYWGVYVGGVLYWVLVVHWIRLPHPLNYLGLAALAGYLGVYLPLFVALARTGVHRFGIPLALVAPIVWTGLDLVRAHLMTGFLMGSLAHSLFRVPTILQIADLVGEYGVTFLIVLTASCLAMALPISGTDPRPRGKQLVLVLLPAFSFVTFAWLYGEQMLSLRTTPQSIDSSLRVALIQGNTLADWKSDPAKQQSIMREYVGLSLEAVTEARQHDGRAVDLVVWPETAFRQTLIQAAEGYLPPRERIHPSQLTAAQGDLQEFTRQANSAALLGIDRIELYPDHEQELAYRAYNSAVLVDADGKLVDTYDKMHLVVFGEFIPFADWFPFLYDLTPLSGGAEPGAAATAMPVKGFVLAPNICYESAVPHLIRRQLLDLSRGEAPVDAFVNLTNDAWFWGSSELDLHLACAVFRAIETRRPWLIAANGGLSAYVTAEGALAQVSKRQNPEFLLVDLPKNPGADRLTAYTRFGDWFAMGCMVCCVVLAVAGFAKRKT